MDLRNCNKCGRVFSFKGIDICSRCSDNQEENFKLVKEYLYDHPGASIKDVSDETGVSEKQILRYLRENRIEIKEESNFFLDCERCGTSIRSGRFCETCVAELKREFESVTKPKTPTENPQKERTKTKMYTADIRKRLK